MKATHEIITDEAPSVRSGRLLMAAAVIAAPRKIEIRTVAVPEPGPNQVRVRLEGCGVCASNIPPWQGKPWFSYPMAPGAPGHEGWGTIDAIGSDVAGFSPGDHVAMISCNAYAEYDVADCGAVLRLPRELDGKPFPAEPLGCAMNVFRRSGIRQGNVVGIVGIGFLGALLTRLASATGAQVVALSRRSRALALAEELGSWKTIAMDDGCRVVEEVRRLTDGDFCDVVIEATGKQPPLDLSAELTRERGRLVIAGYHQDGPRQVDMQLWNWRGLDVINAHERVSEIYLEGMRMATAAVQSGLLNPAPLLTHRFPLDRLAEALTMAEERPDGYVKGLIVF